MPLRSPTISALIRVALPALFLAAVIPNLRAEEARPPTDFEKAYATVIVKNCLACHNATESKGNLDLTRKEGLLDRGAKPPVIVPGKPGESYLIERVTKGSMPPNKAGKRLSSEEVAALSAWVESGAQWPAGRVLSPFEFTSDRRAGYDWWSLQAVSRPALPAVEDNGWVRNAIDAFILSKLQQRGLAPA
ncbi:MAG TPA: c-type cytochrome domain-containing protein, partial [Gemmataceae bacterium]|nr:c-type cytochrome domain-containing protein [Gemmataceae bacterium]